MDWVYALLCSLYTWHNSWCMRLNHTASKRFWLYTRIPYDFLENLYHILNLYPVPVLNLPLHFSCFNILKSLTFFSSAKQPLKLVTALVTRGFYMAAQCTPYAITHQRKFLLLKIPPRFLFECVLSHVLPKNFLHDYLQGHSQQLLWDSFKIYHFFSEISLERNFCQILKNDFIRIPPKIPSGIPLECIPVQKFHWYFS